MNLSLRLLQKSEASNVGPKWSCAGTEVVPKVVGFVLRYRRGLLLGYLAAVHVLLYVLLQARSHAAEPCKEAGGVDKTAEDWWT